MIKGAAANVDRKEVKKAIHERWKAAWTKTKNDHLTLLRINSAASPTTSKQRVRKWPVRTGVVRVLQAPENELLAFALGIDRKPKSLGVRLHRRIV